MVCQGLCFRGLSVVLAGQGWATPGGEGRLLLGHSLGGCSSGETADRYQDRPSAGEWCQPVAGPASPLGAIYGVGGSEVVVDLAGDVALEDPDDLSLAFAFGGAALDVGPRSRVAAHAGEGDPPERLVGVAVSAPVEAVPGYLA